ncbi:glycosyltransferase family 2 protein [Heyndrickxia coagulans]|uniref:glycosyltransferase family 2 protein n=1 Tax=Heyndrickxia coagulans TaxID=1398 RepID=UPI003D1A2D17
MKLSVVTPCFNSSKTIRRTIESVIKQNYPNIEYIIVDGKSNDNTLEIIKNYSLEYNYIKYISEKDNSMTEALNKGIKMATGEVICSINADDEFLPNVLENIMEKFKNNNIDILVGNTRVVQDETKKLIYTATPKLMSSYFLMCILDCLTPESSVFFRRNCFEKVGLFDEKIKYTQDYEFYLRLIKNGYRFTYYDLDISNFYLSKHQYSSAAADKMKAEVCSYISYKSMHLFLRKMRLNGLLRTILNLRRYESFGSFINHSFKKV